MVADDQGETWQEGGKWFVQAARDDEGLRLLREEIPLYHYPKSEMGKAVKARRPFKLKDDAIDCLRAQAAEFFPPIVGKTYEELLEEATPERFKRSNLVKPPGHRYTEQEAFDLTWAPYWEWERRQKVPDPRRHWSEDDHPPAEVWPPPDDGVWPPADDY